VKSASIRQNSGENGLASLRQLRNAVFGGKNKSQVTHNAGSTVIASLQHALRRSEMHCPTRSAFRNHSYHAATIHICPAAVSSTATTFNTHIHNVGPETQLAATETRTPLQGTQRSTPRRDWWKCARNNGDMGRLRLEVKRS